MSRVASAGSTPDNASDRRAPSETADSACSARNASAALPIEVRAMRSAERMGTPLRSRIESVRVKRAVLQARSSGPMTGQASRRSCHATSRATRRPCTESTRRIGSQSHHQAVTT